MARVAIFLCCALLLLVGCQSSDRPQESTLLQVKALQAISGQTLEVQGINKQANLTAQVRLLGIDAPDLQQRPWGNAARERLEQLVAGQTVKLEFDVEVNDQFGRTLAYVWKDTVLLNEQLVKEGHALFVARSPNHKYDQRLERAEQWARLMGLGIWNPEQPMRLTPAEFRRQYR